jgi:UDP-N-acetyl-alpha-D-muramoyl-L-alanyl-L-glutamate epimerase
VTVTLRPVPAARPAVLDRLGIGRAETFRFAAVETAGDEVRLHYDLDGVGRLTETFVFQDVDVVARADRPAVAGALRLLHLTAGISYVKALLPRTIDPGGALDPATHRLLTSLLTDGLGEFAYVNGLDLDDWFQLPDPVDRPAITAADALSAGPLVPVGGGKDSIVTLEAVRSLDPTLFAINPRGPITRTLEAAGLPAVTATRTLDPGLFDLNDRGAFNGHVPVTAIGSAAAVLVAAVRGHRAVLMSNEGSADEPTLVVDGRAVNHQWSKSSAFEHLFAAAVRLHVHPDLVYTSFLRPASELAIAKRFLALDRYDRVFNSCNRAFHLRGETTEWCGECPKCRFVFLVLAPFTTPARLTGIFGRDLLAEAEQTPGFADLAGLGAHKPFECVGEEGESQAALACLATRPEWADHAVVTALRDRVSPGCGDLERRLTTGDATTLPDDVREAFRAAF